MAYLTHTMSKSLARDGYDLTNTPLLGNGVQRIEKSKEALNKYFE